MRRVSRCGAAVLPVLAVLLMAGPPAKAETIRVEVKALAFMPAQVDAHPGDTIEWVNDDFVAHTATASDHKWEVMLPPHKSGRTTVGEAGKVEYFCRFHPNMKGSIAVTPR